MAEQARRYQAYCRPRGSRGPWQKMAGVESDLSFGDCYQKAMHQGELTVRSDPMPLEYDIRLETPAPAQSYATRELRPNLPS